MWTFLLIVPKWRPPLCNTWRGRHWSIAHRLRKQATQLLGTYARLQRVPLATGRRRVSAEIVLAPRQRQPDRDAFDKLLLDSLVGVGLLLDDSDRGLVGRVEVTFRRGTRDDWGTVLFISDVEDLAEARRGTAGLDGTGAHCPPARQERRSGAQKQLACNQVQQNATFSSAFRGRRVP